MYMLYYHDTYTHTRIHMGAHCEYTALASLVAMYVVQNLGMHDKTYMFKTSR